MQPLSVVLFYGRVAKCELKKKKNHQVNACNTVTCLINIMGLILPGLSSAYVGEGVKARSEQVLKLAQQAEQVNST